MSHSPSEAWRLDPDGDGIPCEELTPLTCRSLGTEAAAANWFNKMGHTPTKDPFKLYAQEEGSAENVTALYYLYFKNNFDPYKLRGQDNNGDVVVCPAQG